MFERKEIEFSLDDFIEMHPIPSLNLPDIQEEKCYIPKDGSAYLLFVCSEASRYKGICPVCASAENHVHGSLKEPRLIHDVSVGTVQVDILLNSKRYRCKKCGATYNKISNPTKVEGTCDRCEGHEFFTDVTC